MSSRDHLFLLTPLFPDAAAGSGTFHCPECGQVEGLLSYFPYLRTRLDVSYVDFSRPRPAVVAAIGAENQSCPVLVLGGAAPAGIPVQHHAQTGRTFIAGAAGIASYLAAAHGISRPHP